MRDEHDGAQRLPEELRFALKGLRGVQPTKELDDKLWSAVDTAPEPSPQPPVRPRHPRPRIVGLAAGLLAPAAVCLFFVESESFRSRGDSLYRVRQLSVSVPEGGHAWVELPISIHDHAPSDLPSVHMDAPATLRVRRRARTPLGRLHTSCAERRCVHRWRVQTRPPILPRVQIREPGRYELNVTHSSKRRNVRERFVILATRE